MSESDAKDILAFISVLVAMLYVTWFIYDLSTKED